MTELKVLRADPAGNITLFVLTPVPAEQRGGLAEKLMAMPEFAAEQVGYQCDVPDGFDGYMEMAGGEFCGNASRAYGYMTALDKGLSGKHHLVLKVSGSDTPVEVDVDTDAGTARAKMPLPQDVMKKEAGGKTGILVDLGGIAHFVVNDVEPSEEYFAIAEKEIFEKMRPLDAFGVMFRDSSKGTLTPFVKVPAANSLFREGSCGSGSLSVVTAETLDKPDGDYAMDIIQPAGVVRAEVVRRSGKVTEAYIGGSVTLDRPVTVKV